jgi:hypothetical protein
MNEDMEAKYRVYFVGLRTFLRLPDISPAAKAVFMNILMYAGEDGKAFPSQARLAADLGVSERHIRTLINELKRHNMLTWRQKERNGPNYYTPSPEVYRRAEELGRKSISARNGNRVPSPSGSPVPAKVITESIKKGSQSPLVQKLQLLRGKPLSDPETDEFHHLVSDSGPEKVGAAMDRLRARGKDSGISVPYLREVVSDTVPGKPVFTPCGKCRNGYTVGQSGDKWPHTCLRDFQLNLQGWERTHRR